jgi:hypothetical protein
MYRLLYGLLLGILASATWIGCGHPSHESERIAVAHDLTGAWRSKITFHDGPFAAIKDLEFLYVFNAGGTMTESSNYDAAPPVPPAYGIWRKTERNEFEAKYEFYLTKALRRGEAAESSDGWLPAGRGVLTEKLSLSEDGRRLTSNIRYEILDPMDKPSEGGGVATGEAVRLGFDN